MQRKRFIRVSPLPARTGLGFSMVGILISMALMAVMFSIMMTAMNKRVTGEGSSVEGTVNTQFDMITLKTLHQGLYIYSISHKDQFLVPSEMGRGGPRSLDTTANFYSALIALEYITPETLVSRNEYGDVEVMEDYNRYAYQPLDDQYWDPNFKADLDDYSNVSYAHLPLYGKRFKKNWNVRSRFPILGNRGPKDGIEDPMSYSYGRNGIWAGHMIFGDGSIDFIHTFTPGSVMFNDHGEMVPDNIFKIEDGPDGGDAILSFTKEMTEDGPVLQWD